MSSTPTYDAKKLRDDLGLEDGAPLLSVKKPEPEIIDHTMMDVISQEALFTPEECARIISENSQDDWLDSSVNKGSKDDTETKRDEIRNSQNIWIEPSEKNIWLFDKMLAIITAANKMYQFDIDYFEQFQLAKYEEGEYFNWHVDLGPQQMGNRKLSITVQLTAPEDYEGGDLILDIDHMEDDDGFHATRELGSVTVFPSFMKHRVDTVTKGTRYSLVVWCSGTQRFK